MKVKQKILAVLDSLDINDSSGTKGRIALINNLAILGYQVTALHYSLREIQLEGIECVAVKERKGNLLFLLSRVQRLLYRWLKVDIGPWVDSRFGFSFGFFNDANSLRKSVANYRPEDFDMIWTLSKGNSYRPHKAILGLPQWYSKWYAYVHDPFPQQLYPRPYNFVPFGFRKKRMFFREITLKANRVVFPSKLLSQWMQSYYVDLEKKSIIIPHQIALPAKLDSKLPDYFSSEKFTILHGGNLLDLRDPKPLIDSFLMFLAKNPSAAGQVSFLFLGKKSHFAKYLHEKIREIPQLFVSDDYVPFEEVYAMQQRASINVILEAKSEISPFLPGKFAHCVAANAPIILVGPYYSECKRLLGTTYPYKFEFDELDKISNAFENLYTKWLENKSNLRLNRPDLEHYLSSEYLKEVLEKSAENSLIQ